MSISSRTILSMQVAGSTDKDLHGSLSAEPWSRDSIVLTMSGGGNAAVLTNVPFVDLEALLARAKAECAKAYA